MDTEATVDTVDAVDAVDTVDTVDTVDSDDNILNEVEGRSVVEPPSRLWGSITNGNSLRDESVS